jgi:hypothetical protein
VGDGPRLLVATADVSKALRAAHPFTVDKVDSLSRVRFTCTPVNTFVAATNGHAAALALVSTIALDVPDGPGPVEFDLTGLQARTIAGLFKRGKDDDEEMGAELRFDVDQEHVTVTDASGMIEGQQLVIPRVPMSESTPRIVTVFAARAGLGHKPHRDRPPRLHGANLALMVGAAKVYGAELVVEHRAADRPDANGSLLVRVGESFLGTVTETWINEDEAAERARWAAAWQDRLTHLGVVQEGPLTHVRVVRDEP